MLDGYELQIGDYIYCCELFPAGVHTEDFYDRVIHDNGDIRGGRYEYDGMGILRHTEAEVAVIIAWSEYTEDTTLLDESRDDLDGAIEGQIIDYRVVEMDTDTIVLHVNDTVLLRAADRTDLEDPYEIDVVRDDAVVHTLIIDKVDPIPLRDIDFASDDDQGPGTIVGTGSVVSAPDGGYGLHSGDAASYRLDGTVDVMPLTDGSGNTAELDWNVDDPEIATALSNLDTEVMRLSAANVPFQVGNRVEVHVEERNPAGTEIIFYILESSGFEPVATFSVVAPLGGDAGGSSGGSNDIVGIGEAIFTGYVADNLTWAGRSLDGYSMQVNDYIVCCRGFMIGVRTEETLGQIQGYEPAGADIEAGQRVMFDNMLILRHTENEVGSVIAWTNYTGDENLFLDTFDDLDRFEQNGEIDHQVVALSNDNVVLEVNDVVLLKASERTDLADPYVLEVVRDGALAHSILIQQVDSIDETVIDHAEIGDQGPGTIVGHGVVADEFTGEGYLPHSGDEAHWEGDSIIIETGSGGVIIDLQYEVEQLRDEMQGVSTMVLRTNASNAPILFGDEVELHVEEAGEVIVYIKRNRNFVATFSLEIIR